MKYIKWFIGTLLQGSLLIASLGIATIGIFVVVGIMASVSATNAITVTIGLSILVALVGVVNWKKMEKSE